MRAVLAQFAPALAAANITVESDLACGAELIGLFVRRAAAHDRGDRDHRVLGAVLDRLPGLRLDPDRPVLLEAESSKIGNLIVPPSFWQAMRQAPRIQVTAPVQERGAYLARRYFDVIDNQPLLLDRLKQLVPYQGHEKVAAWCELAKANR